MEQLDVEADSVRGVVEELQRRFPGIEERLCENGGLLPGLQISVDQVLTRSLSTKVEAASEVHFLPAIGGG